MRIKYYVIEHDERPRLRWSKNGGWVSWETREDYSHFTDSERAIFDLPKGGHWVLVSQYIPEGK